MKLKFLILFTFFCSFASTALPLDKPSLQRAINIMAEINLLADQHPEWENQQQTQNFFADANGNGFIQYLKNVGAYHAVNDIAVKHGFQDIEQGYGVFRNAMLAVMKLQFEQLNMDFDELLSFERQRLEMLQTNGASTEMLKEQEARIEEYNALTQAFNSVKDTDKDLMKENSDWFLVQLEQIGMDQ